MDTYKWMVEQEQDLLYLVEQAYGSNEMSKIFSKSDEGKAVIGTYSDGSSKVQGTILSVFQYGTRVDVKEIISSDGAYRIAWGVPASMLHFQETE